jgi:hypothetical protein
MVSVPDQLWADLKIHCIRHDDMPVTEAVKDALELYLKNAA